MSALCGAVTHPGRARQVDGHNEDALWIPTHLDPSLVSQYGALYVVADGIGGHANGEVASQLAVETMRTVYYQNANPDRRQALYQTVLAANTAIYQSTQSITGGAANRMGSTVVAIVIKDNQVLVANLGDSRAYLVRGGQAHVLSQDHTVVAELLRRQLITAEESATHPDRSSLMRSLGQESGCQPFVSDWLPLQAGDRVVVCTDGLWDVVGDPVLARLANRGTPDTAAHALVNAANERGGPDNITVIVVGDATQTGAGWLAPIMAAPVLWLAGGIGLIFLTAILVIALAGAGTQPKSTPLAQAVPSPVAIPPMGTAIPTEPMTPATVPAQLPTEAVAPVHAAPELPKCGEYSGECKGLGQIKYDAWLYVKNDDLSMGYAYCNIPSGISVAMLEDPFEETPGLKYVKVKVARSKLTTTPGSLEACDVAQYTIRDTCDDTTCEGYITEVSADWLLNP